MTDGQHDGILNPADSEPVTATPAVEAVKLWQNDPTEDTWAAARAALAPPGEQDEVEAALLAVVTTTGKTQAAALAALYELVSSRQPIKTTTWADLPNPPKRKWLVKNWLPTGCVTMLSGRGGFGKSRLALQLAAGVASGGGYPDGQPNCWIEGPVDQDNPVPLDTDAAPVLYVSWEDDGREFSRRLAAVSSSKAAPWVKQDRLEGLHFADMAGRGPTWGPAVGASINSRATLLPAGELLRERAEKLEAQLVVLDPLAAAWIGNENDRSLVRAFMADWDAWARQRSCGVMVVAHEPKSRESGPAGSTDWEAAARAVWTLGKEKHGPEPKGRSTPDDRPEKWKLELFKSNYSKPEALKMNLDLKPGEESVRWCIEGPWDSKPEEGGYTDE